MWLAPSVGQEVSYAALTRPRRGSRARQGPRAQAACRRRPPLERRCGARAGEAPARAVTRLFAPPTSRGFDRLPSITNGTSCVGRCAERFTLRPLPGSCQVNGGVATYRRPNTNPPKERTRTRRSGGEYQRFASNPGTLAISRLPSTSKLSGRRSGLARESSRESSIGPGRVGRWSPRWGTRPHPMNCPPASKETRSAARSQ